MPPKRKRPLDAAKRPATVRARNAHIVEPHVPAVPPELPYIFIPVCPYTGVLQKIAYDDVPGKHNGWYTQGGLDLTLPFFTEADAVKACPEAVCRYTGEQLDLVEERGMFSYPEAWSPDTRYATREGALYAASMRDGRPFAPPPRKVTVTERTRPDPDPFEDRKKAADITPLVEEVIDRVGG